MKDLIINSQYPCLKLQSKGIIRFLPLSEILYLKSVGNYTCIIMKDPFKYTMPKTLQSFETQLGNHFFRCHKSYLINTVFICEINMRNRYILLTTGEKIPFSRNKSKILEKKMEIQTSLNYQL